MIGLPTTASPGASHGVICFEHAHGCVEVRIGPSTQEGRAEISRPPNRSLCADRSLLWDSKLPITVSFIDDCNISSFTDEQVKDIVKNGAHDWARGTSLNFIFLRPDHPKRNEANIRISFQEDGIWSVLGTTPVEYGEPTMNLGFKRDVEEARIKRAVLHEFGHALGFHHEHSSPKCPLHLDRQAIMKENHISDELFDDNFAKLAMSGSIEASPFDVDSIMMYTIWPKWNEEGAYIARSLALSETDRKWVRKWYPPHSHQQCTVRIQSRPSMQLSMNSQLKSLTQHEGSNLIYDFRCDRPECQERQCDTCFRYTYYLGK